jgi:hypothetical protein
MTHEPEPPTQAIFVGWLAIGLLALMVVFTFVVIGAGATTGFS